MICGGIQGGRYGYSKHICSVYISYAFQKDRKKSFERDRSIQNGQELYNFIIKLGVAENMETHELEEEEVKSLLSCVTNVTKSFPCLDSTSPPRAGRDPISQGKDPGKLIVLHLIFIENVNGTINIILMFFILYLDYKITSYT